MANNLAKLRKEFKLTQNDLANILQTTSTNIGYYETEKRDFSTKLLFTLSELFQVSIDYLLANTNKGIKIYYDGNIVLEFIISDDLLDELTKRNVVYYLNDSYKRYVNINNLLGLKGYDLTNLMKSITDLEVLFELLPNIPINSKDDLDCLYSISKIKSLDDNKVHAIKKILEYL